MKLVNLEQKVFIPIVDESKGGATYEVQMSVAEVFEKFFEGNTPKIVEAVPVEWLRQEAMKDDGLINSVIRGLLTKWWKEQEAGK